MQLALQIAEMGRSQTSPNPMVGAVLVKDGEIVGQGAHLKAGEPHAEVHALRMAGQRAEGATAYVTLEPCSHHGRTPPCADALIQAGVQKVVVAAVDPNPLVQGGGLVKLRQAGIETITGVLGSLAEQQNEAFFTWVRTKRPFVVWKCATTLDGYIAANSGHSSYVTGPESREAVQHLRQQYPAIGVGIGTILADDPRLTVRHLEHSDVHQPLRVVFDSHLRMPTEARLLQEPGETLVYTTEAGQRAREANRAPLSMKGIHTVVIPADESGRVSLADALVDLGQRGVHSLLVEGGAQLASSLLADQLIDKVVYYLAPKLLGGGIPALQSKLTTHMAQAIPFEQTSWSQVGADMCFIGYPQYLSPDAQSADEDSRG